MCEIAKRGQYLRSLSIKRASFILLSISIIGGLFLYEKFRDPLSVIDQPAGKVALLKEAVLENDNLPQKRDYRRILLSTAHLGDIEAVISRPEKITKKLPVLLVMGGWEVGAKNFKLIPEPGDYILVIYRYPYMPKNWKEGASVQEVFRIRDAIYSVPSQVLALTDWLSGQAYVDKERISLLGFSLGALFLPSVYHLDAVTDKQLNAGVIAFGGVDIGDILQTNLRNVHTLLRTAAAQTAAFFIDAVEPLHHLPHMENEFLLINASKDEMMSRHSRELLIQLTPEPKNIITLDAGHIGANKVKLVEEVVGISTKWLTEKGILEAHQ